MLMKVPKAAVCWLVYSSLLRNEILGAQGTIKYSGKQIILKQNVSR